MQSADILHPANDQNSSISLADRENLLRTHRSPQPITPSETYKLNLHGILWERASADSADFVEGHLHSALVFRTLIELWNYTISRIMEQGNIGLMMEFGVYNGTSINYFSRRLPDLQFYGFDSFYGLKTDWSGHHAAKGRFSLNGVLPQVEDNVLLVPGWFNETVPSFLGQKTDDICVRFAHIDGDTYEAATSALLPIAPRLRPGSLILFDEMIGYPNWRNGEFRAWNEIADRHSIAYRYIAFASEQALIEIVDLG